MRKSVFQKFLKGFRAAGATLVELVFVLRQWRPGSLFWVTVILGVVALILAGFIWRIEGVPGNNGIGSYTDSLWFMLVTMTTTGYGDIVPQSGDGRLVTIIAIVIGMILTAIATGILTSLFVEKKIREGRGLKRVKAKNHIVLCGWNQHGSSVLEGFTVSAKGKRSEIVLVNELPETEIGRVIASFRTLKLHFVRGNPSDGKVLEFAAVGGATSAIVLADEFNQAEGRHADERTILSVMALRSLNAEIKISAQIVNPENREHLKRAGVDEVVFDGEFSGYLIANSTISPGVHQLVSELLSYQFGHTIVRVKIPETMVGKTFNELSNYFREKRNSIVIGVITEEPGVDLDNLLAGDFSTIDSFIRKKFAEAEAAEGDRSRMNIRINPGADYLIVENDSAFIITSDLTQVA